MTYTVLFIVTLVVVSGLIAYLGDWLGRKMGKRRLSLFGMRPRHTAIVVTTITGMIIAAITLGTMLAVSSSLRQVLIRGERLAREIKAYQVTNRQLHARSLKLSETSERLTREVSEKSRQVRVARKETAAAILARDKILLRVNALETEIKSRQTELADLRRTGRLTQEQLKRISTTLDDRVRELSAVKTSLAARNEELAQKQRDLDSKNQELGSKIAQLQEAEAQIQEAEATIKHHRELIEAQKRALNDEIMRTEMLLVGDFVLQQGQELGRKVIDSTLPREQVKAELLDLLNDASEEARQSDAGSGRGSRAIRLVYLDRKSWNVVDDESACMEKAVDAIVEQGRKGSVHSVIVRVTVVSNTLKGNNALVEFGPFFWNKLAYRRGENIARLEVDGRMSEGRILLAVMNFLRDNVRSAAQREGVVPISGQDLEDSLEPLSDKQLDDLMELVETIRTIGKPVELRAIADNDIYAAGPLNLSNIDFAVSTLTSASR